MLKAVIIGKMLLIENSPSGRVSFSKDYLIGLKKDDFEKSHKHLGQTGAIWKVIKPYTSESKWK